MVEEVVLDDEMSMCIEQILIIFIGRHVVVFGYVGSQSYGGTVGVVWEVLLAYEYFLSAVVLAWFLHGGEEDGVVFPAWTELFVPFLDEEHAGLGPGVWFEYISVQSHDGQYSTSLGYVVAYVAVAAVVEPSLRQHYGHASSGFEEVEVTLYKEYVASHLGGEFSRSVLAQLVFREYAAFLDVASKWWISHQNVESEVTVAVFVCTHLLQLLPSVKVGVLPILIL